MMCPLLVYALGAELLEAGVVFSGSLTFLFALCSATAIVVEVCIFSTVSA